MYGNVAMKSGTLEWWAKREKEPVKSVSSAPLAVRHDRTPASSAGRNNEFLVPSRSLGPSSLS